MLVKYSPCTRARHVVGHDIGQAWRFESVSCPFSSARPFYRISIPAAGGTPAPRCGLPALRKATFRYAPLRLAARRQPTPQQPLQRQRQGQRQQKNTTAPPRYRHPPPTPRFATRCKSKFVRSESPRSTSQFSVVNIVSPYFGGFRQPFTLVRVGFAARRPQGLCVVDPCIHDRSGLGVVAEEQPKPPPDLRAPPVTVGWPQGVAQAELVARGIAWNNLHDQLAQGPEQLDVGVVLETLRIVPLGPRRAVCSLHNCSTTPA